MPFFVIKRVKLFYTDIFLFLSRKKTYELLGKGKGV